jgi:6-phosphofructokinase 1
MYVQRTFGVTTAIERAAQILECAHMEARSAFNGIGLVKVMGREAGFIACGATLASQEVNLTLIPELPFTLEGPDGVLAFLKKRLESRQHALVVVAEGAGQQLMAEAAGAGAGGTDRSGNRKLADIGVYLKQRFGDYFKSINMPADIKYFDPSYYIRSIRANSEDAILCDQLARHAVHAAMAGKTGLVVGLWNSAFTHIPIDMATSGKKQVDPEAPLWTSVLAATGQPRRFC